jgi:hypothetical protein
MQKFGYMFAESRKIAVFQQEKTIAFPTGFIIFPCVVL